MSYLDWREPVSAWSHFAWLVLAVPGTLLLWKRSAGDRPKQISLLIFGLSLMFCYGGSVLYHSVQLPQEQIDWCETVDYLGIFALIAGSGTPLLFNLLEGRWRWGMVLMAWGLACIGAVLRIVFWNVPPWVYTSLYLLMGWSLVISYFELARLVTHRAMALIFVGGLLYSIGAAMNVLLPRDCLWPGVFGPHELFHLFVMSGSLVHYWFMLTVVVPYERAGAEAEEAFPSCDLAGDSPAAS
jgi:hemolysin III